MSINYQGIDAIYTYSKRYNNESKSSLSFSSTKNLDNDQIEEKTLKAFHDVFSLDKEKILKKNY